MCKQVIIGIVLGVFVGIASADMDLLQVGPVVEVPSNLKDFKRLDGLLNPPASKPDLLKSKKGLKSKHIQKNAVNKIGKASQTNKAVKQSKEHKVSEVKKPSQANSKVVKTEKAKKAAIAKSKNDLSVPIVKQTTVKFEEKPIDELDFKDPKPVSYNISKLDPIIAKGKSTGHVYLGIMGGVSIAKVGEEISYVDGEASFIDDQYSPDSGYRSVAVAYGINGGYEFNLSPRVLLSFGIGIYQDLNNDAEGKLSLVYDGISDDRFDYKYNFLSTRFMFEGQLGWQFYLNNKRKLIPFVLLGAGPALNYVSNYKDNAASTFNVAESGFSSHTTTSFSYQLGAGIAYTVNEHGRLFTTYRYVDLGKAHFGSSANYPYQLDIGKTKTQEIYLGYTYLFNF